MSISSMFASYLTVYDLILLAIVIRSTTVLGILYLFGTLRASRSIYQKLIESLLGTT